MRKKLYFSNIRTWAALLIAGAAFAACSSDDDSLTPTPSPNGEGNEQVYTMTIQASKVSDATTRALVITNDGSKNSLNAKWDEGEKVEVYQSGSKIGELTAAASSTASTTLTGTLDSAPSTSEAMTFYFHTAATPSYSNQDGTLETIATSYDFCAPATVSTDDFTVDNENMTISVPDGISFGENQQAIVKFTLMDKATDATINATSLTVSDGTDIYTVTLASPTNVVYVAIPGFSGKNVTLTASNDNNVYTYGKSGVSFTNSQYYEITVKMTSLTIPLTFEAKEAGATVSFGFIAQCTDPVPSIQYSTDGKNWYNYSNPITLDNKGDKVSFRGNNASYCDPMSSRFSCTGECYIYGNIMSLVSSEDYATANALTANYAFGGLFHENVNIYNHPTKDLVLPATELTESCYENMFYGCTGLTRAPALPATTLTKSCYEGMFYGCTGLTRAPALPATTLTKSCYEGMFYGCTGLTRAPALPATTLADYCYTMMFQGCTSLSTAPDLPAMSMKNHCYSQMFRGCTSLSTAPDLPAMSMEESCYKEMFSGCTSLTTAPQLPAMTLADNCYIYMFKNCTNLTAAPQLPATTLMSWCYCEMFYGCSKLNSVTCLATDISALGSTEDWLNGVAATGTFTTPSTTEWSTGASGIPSGWTRVNAQ